MKNYLKEVKVRVLWLSIGLVLSLVIAQIIKGFESTLEENLILASFIPLVVYMSDAVGTQMEAIVIRQMAGKKRFGIRKFFIKQVLIVSTVAIIIGSLAALIVYIIDDSIMLGWVIGISLIGGIMSSLITGTLIPYVFWKLHNDPAEASGPVATVIQDMLSVVIFFLVAQALL